MGREDGCIGDSFPTIKRCLRGAVERYGYSQREVADHLGMHFSSISRIMREGMLIK